MHALCPSHRQSRRQQTKYDCMSVPLTSDHSKIFFAAVTGTDRRLRRATAGPHRHCGATLAAAVPLHCRTQPPHCHSRTASLSSATRRRLAVTCQRVARRVPPRQHCRCTQAATACQCRRACAAAPLHCRRTASARVRRVRTESALTPQCRRCRVTPCAAAPHCRVCRRCRRTAAHWSRDSTSMSSHCRLCRVVCRQCRHCRAAD